MSLALRYAALSHVGLLRTGNEDSGYAGPRLLAVADGMGGHAAGEVASAVAIASLAGLDEDAPGADLTGALAEAATSANDHLRDMVQGDAALDGMGTTLTALLFAGSRVGLLHIGDSRCYLLRDGALSRITRDDTLVQSLVDEGRITEDEATTHPQRSLITRALDGREGVDFDLRVREARVGDRYLLCSDGLTGPVRDASVQEALEVDDLTAAVERLVDLALRGGGPDNVTVVVADVIDTAADDPTGVPVVAGAASERPQSVPETVTGGAAGRAKAVGAPPPADPVVADDAPGADRPRGRRGLKAGLAGLGVVVLLLAGALAGYLYLGTQWYVGVDGERVAVYRGVTGSIAGVELHRRDRTTDLETGQLTASRLDQLERGIVADDEADAERILGVLEEEAAAAAAPAPAPAPVPTPAPGGVTPPTAATTAPP